MHVPHYDSAISVVALPGRICDLYNIALLQKIISAVYRDQNV